MVQNISDDAFDHSLVDFNFLISRNRKFEFGGIAKHVNLRKTDKSNHISFTLGNNAVGTYGTERIGNDCCTDTSKYYSVSTVIESNNFFKGSEDKFIEVSLRIDQNGYGKSKSLIKDFYIKDITDTDNDKFIDFEDNCPLEFGSNKGCPQLTSIINNALGISIEVFPNPASDRIFVKGVEFGKIALFDIDGRLVYETLKDRELITIDISHLNEKYLIFSFRSLDNSSMSRLILNK